MAFQQGPANILCLPNELLQVILEHVCRDVDDRHYAETHEEHVTLREARSLSLVCKQFNDLALPLLYRDLCGRCVLPLRSIQNERLTRTLESRSDLCAMVKTLTLAWTMKDPPQLVCEAILFFRKMINVKTLKIIGDFRQFEMFTAFVWCIGEMSYLEELDLHCEWPAGPPIRVVLALLGPPSVRKWKLSSVSFADAPYDFAVATSDISESGWTDQESDLGGSNSEEERGDDEEREPEQSELAVTQPEMKLNQLMNGLNGMCAVTSLHIDRPFCGPDELALILAWPRALEHFRFEEFFDFDQGYEEWSAFSLRFFSTALRPHRVSLKTLRLSYIYTNDKQHSLEVADFSNLGMLHLSLENFSYASPERTASALLAPKLHTVVFDASPTDSQLGTFDVLDQSIGQWFVRFAECAQAQ